MPAPQPHLPRHEELRQLGRLCLRLAGFVALVVALQSAVARWTRWDRPEAYSERLAALAHVRDGDVVYFGDSVLTAHSAKDQDLRRLPEVLAARLKPTRLTAFAHPAFQPNLFAAVTSYLLRSGRRPAVFVVPINLRAFSPVWAQRPSWQFQKEVALLDMGVGPGSALMRFRVAFKETPPAPPDPGEEELWRRADFRGLRGRFPASVPEAPLGRYPGPVDFTRMYYLADVGPQHPYFRALVRIGEEAHRAGVPVLFYMTPIDLETVTAQLSPRLQAEVAARSARFRAALEPTGAQFEDLSSALPSEVFMWREEGAINEHLTADGRLRLSRILARRIRPLVNGGPSGDARAER